MIPVLLGVVVATVVAWIDAPPPQLDNGVTSLPEVKCLEDQLKLTFKTQRPFQGRIFVKGMSDKDSCVSKYIANTKPEVTFELHNGACNMRRTRMLGPERRGMEQSITVIVSFHSTFITKVDKAYRCTCFYMEADEVVSSRFDVSALPTTDVIDTARMPVCSYTVRRDSIRGPLVQYAKIGDPVYHVWQCDSGRSSFLRGVPKRFDMFSMLVHSCFVDDSNGQDRKAFIDEHGCAIDPIIVPDLKYNKENNFAYSQVNVFSFADKVSISSFY
uniref:ZP domain-containing protein n=1 Tax=Angiostrongylus cantonensis TaxID=6313 RepID=A0A0K0DJ28_ANGCA